MIEQDMRGLLIEHGASYVRERGSSRGHSCAVRECFSCDSSVNSGGGSIGNIDLPEQDTDSTIYCSI